MRNKGGDGTARADQQTRDHLVSVYRAAVAAVDPARLVTAAIAKSADGFEIGGSDQAMRVVVRGRRIGVFGAGKAAASMAVGFEEACGESTDVGGTVIGVTPAFAAANQPSRIRVLFGEHPVPGPASVACTASVIEEIRSQTVDHFVCLVSGGASSLLAAPMTPLTLEDKRRVTELLLGGGATIDEINTVRKHLSAVKGGRILGLVGGRPVTTLILSDVVGDNPASVGSGPTVPDTSTYAEAIEVLRRHDLLPRCPEAAVALLESGARGEIPETVRPASRLGRLATSFVIGSNALAVGAAAAEAARLGYSVAVHPTPLTGDTTTCATEWLRDVRRRISESSGGALCFVAGGETTVRVAGSGIGGRNQEFALSLVDQLEGSGIAVLSAGTDGIDGPTEAAGAFVDGASQARALRRGLVATDYLRRNDSFNYFRQIGDLFTVGPTGTNVMDVKIALTRVPSGP